jgi:tetratricopeptide (TPR) repeat protein
MQQPRLRIIQTFIVIWLDPNINESDADCQNSVGHLRRIVSSVNIFTDNETCLQFLNGIKDEIVFMIVSVHLYQQIVPLIQQIDQLRSIYVFSGDKEQHELSRSEWSKVKGVFKQVESICDSLKRDIKQCYTDMISISTFSSTDASDPHFDQLDQSFMYSQLLKEILLEIDQDDDKARKSFVEFYRSQYSGNDALRPEIGDFEQNYPKHSPIWWYTKEPFIYETINRALRTQETEIIVKMSFFMRDLHRQIKGLHTKFADHKPITIYRGQGLFNEDFEKMRKNKGGLLSFNSFLSTTTDDLLALARAESAKDDPNLTGIFFKMKFEPELASTSFAGLDDVSHYRDSEKEILFSMHSVFRIEDITPIQDKVWKVELILTKDNDQDLMCLTNYIRKEIKGTLGWQRLGQLLITIGKFNQAEEVYKSLRESTSNKNPEIMIHIQHQLGNIFRLRGEYSNALSSYQEELTTREKFRYLNDPEVAITYDNIGIVHQSKGQYSHALSFYRKALDIRKKTLLCDNSGFADSYNNIGGVYCEMGEYLKALPLYQKTLEIDQKCLPPNHPSLATTYNNIGAVHRGLGDFSSSLTSYQNALEIQLKSVPSDHFDVAATYSNIGLVYRLIGNHPFALLFYNQALEIRQKCLPPEHPEVAINYNNISLVHRGNKDYSAALSFCQKAFEIQQKSLRADHPVLATTYNNMGLVYQDMKDYSNALSFYQKAREIDEKSLPPYHPDAAFTCNNIAGVYRDMGDYSGALSLLQKTLETQQKSPCPNNRSLAIIHNSMATAYESLQQFDKAVEHGELAVDIASRIWRANYYELQLFQNNLDRMRKKL